jgi:dipeptidyl aminopeptidase/acylaminoacyl peptidase
VATRAYNRPARNASAEEDALPFRPSLLSAGLVVLLHAASAPAAGTGLTLDALLEIRHPSSPVFSPDGGRLVFVWERAGVQNLFLIEGPGPEPSAPRPLTRFTAGGVESVSWSPDGRSVFFVREGDLWSVAAPGASPPAPLWTTPEAEGDVAFSPDGKLIAFVRSDRAGIPEWQRTQGAVFVRALAGGRERQLSAGDGVASGPVWSPDGARIVYTTTPATARSDTPDYSGGKLAFRRVDHGAARAVVVPAEGGQPVVFPPSPGWGPSPHWLDATHLVLLRVGDDGKAREILVGDAVSGQTRVLYREEDALFWSLDFIVPEAIPSPDGRRVAFVSDRDSWDHLYVVPTAGGEPVPLTRGTFEVRSPAWSPDGQRIAFDASEANDPGIRRVMIASLGADGRAPALARATEGRGTSVSPVWSPDGRSLVFQHADARRSADLFRAEASSGGRPSPAARLTDSMPAGLDHEAFVAPERVSYTAPDGRRVPAYLFVPPGLDRGSKHPAIVWVHGDGINQNYDGWHVQLNYAVYYSFHQYLLQKGYVVLAPDYRGSIGYGREWRQGVYMDVGGKDAQDAAAAADYLKALGYVDPERIGIWGLSYGGFFTLIAMTDRPTAYRCGVDVAGSVDYRMWYEDPGGAWVTARMGTPETQPAVYDRAAVAFRMDRIERPLLVLHGTADMNVPFLESVRLVDELLKHGKDVEMMIYPGEFHYFRREHVLRDAWARVERFFDAHLKGPLPR